MRVTLYYRVLCRQRHFRKGENLFCILMQMPFVLRTHRPISICRPSNVVFRGGGEGVHLVTDLGGTRDARVISVQIVHFHTVFGKDYAKYNRLFPPPPRKSWICHRGGRGRI